MCWGHSYYIAKNKKEHSGVQYKFGGKEYQDEFDLNTYDFGARNYDPALGRWMNIDTLADFIKEVLAIRLRIRQPDILY